MPRRKPTIPITLTDRQQAVLDRIERREKSTQQQVRRASVISLAAKQLSNYAIAKALELTLQTVRRWRARWHPISQAMRTAEDNGDHKQLEQLILEALSDDERSGRPAAFTPEQSCAIVAIACENPEDSQRAISHWTARELADEAIKRGIVTEISPRTVGRFLKRSSHQAPFVSLLAQCQI
jgi:transposase